MLNTILITTVYLTVGLSAHGTGNAVTPYGDYCGYCATYGTCKSTLPLQEAIAAIETYYREKGYRLGRIRHRKGSSRSRFTGTDSLVDKVLFAERPAESGRSCKSSQRRSSN